MKLVTVEMVGKGHPDKVADQISDMVVDWCTSRDPNAHVAIETMLKNNKVFITGELSSSVIPNKKNYMDMVKKVFKSVKYEYKPKLIIEVSIQSPDIAQGVSRVTPEEQGAGDQGMTFGYASDETESFMPYTYTLARTLMMGVDDLNTYASIKGDGKCQVSVNEKGEIVQIVVSKQTSDEQFLKDEVNKLFSSLHVMHNNKATSFKNLMTKDCKIFINPTGKFEIGGPFGDAGLTGRKIIMDTYGGIAHHGGGCFSGKSLDKVDRSGAIYARMLALKVIQEKLAKECEIRLDFVIGMPHVLVTCTYCDNGNYTEIEKYLNSVTKNLTVKKMIDEIKGKIPSFSFMAIYGAFGKTENF